MLTLNKRELIYLRSPRSHTIAALGLFLALSFSVINTKITYILYGITCLLILVYRRFRFGWVLRYSIKYDATPGFEHFLIWFLCWCWVFITIGWFVSFLNGLLSGAPLIYASSNFFALTLYLTFPLLVGIRLGLIQVVHVVVLAAVFQICYLSYWMFNSSFYIFYNIFEFSSLSQLRTKLSDGSVIVLAVLSLNLALIFYKSNASEDFYKAFGFSRYLGWLSLLLIVSSILIPTMSKGLMLVVFMLVSFAWLMALLDSTHRNRLNLRSFGMGGLFIIALIAMPNDWLELIFFTFSSEESSNSLRSEQMKYLVDEFSFFGSGLGTMLKSGYTRDDGLFGGYGFELSYVNLAQKMGVFSIPLFISYFITVLIPVMWIWQRRRRLESYFCIGLMGFLIPGAGNPVLVSPVSVLLHVFAMYILIYPYHSGLNRITIPGIFHRSDE